MANKPTKPNFPLGLESQEQSVFQEGILNNGVVEHGPDAVMTVPETPDASGVPSAVRYNEDDDQFEGYYNEGGWLPLGGGNGGRWELLPYASSSLLQAGRAYLVDNTDGVSTVLFPSPKRVGDSVTVCDLYGKFSTYPLTVDGNGKSIYGSADSMTISTDNVSATFTWTGEARGWVITSGVGLGQGRVYSREIYSQILSALTPSITLSTQPSIVDVYVDGKRLKESLYTLDGYEVKFDPALASGSDVQIIQYIPIQLGAGGGGSGGTVITWEYNGGSAIGGETQIVLDVVVDSVSEIYIRGSRQQIGRGFTFDPATSTITLADELEAGDDVVVVINGDPTVYNQIDRTPWEVARSNNVKNSEVILSTDKQTALDGKTVLYDVVTQTSWGIPEGIPVGSKIISVVSDILNYTTGSVNLLPIGIEKIETLCGFKHIGQFSSAESLAATSGSNGDRVLLLGYHDGWAASSSELSGGGEFHYVSSLAGENNGVTIFNGWVRKFTDTVITTYDAGLGDNDGVDARERLTTLFKVVPDGFTVKIRGYHIVSGPVKCEGKTGLTIDGMNGVISAKELRDVYTVYDVAETNNAVAMTGVLSCLNCPGIKIFGLEIQGAMKLSVRNDNGTHKGEEHALVVRACDGGEIWDTHLHNVFGYGCRGLYQSNVKFHHNYVHHCLRESGVNLVTGGSHGYIYCNRFEYIGLYGLEVEGQPYYGGMTDVTAWGNYIKYAKWGIAVVDQCLSASLHHNNIEFCHTGLSAFRTIEYDVTSTLFDTNTIRSCVRAMFASNARNANFRGNDIDLNDKPDYLYTSSYNNVFEVLQTDRRIFWSPYLSQFHNLIGKNVKIADVIYSVSAAEWDGTKTGYPKDSVSEPDGLWKVTLDKALPDELDDTIANAMTQDFGDTIAYQSDGEIHGVTVDGNPIKNAHYALYCTSHLADGDSGIQETIINNPISGAVVWLTFNGSGFRLIDRNEPNADATVTASLWSTAGFKDVRMRNTMGISLPARTVNTSLLKPRLYSQIARRAVGVRITLLNTNDTSKWTGTGVLQVTLNGQVVVGSGNFTQGSEDPIQLFTQMAIVEGSNTIQVNTSNNDLLYAACMIELLIP